MMNSLSESIIRSEGVRDDDDMWGGPGGGPGGPPRGVVCQRLPTGGGAHYVVKCVMLGDHAVGKTSLLRRYVNGDRQCGKETISTVGVDFMHATEHVNHTVGGAPTSTTVKLQIWDTAGQERFSSIIGMYLRNVYAYIVVFDVTNRASFEHVRAWKRRVDAQLKQDRRSQPHQRCVLLLANKTDCASVVDDHDIEDLVVQERFDGWYKTSMHYSVREVFANVATAAVAVASTGGGTGTGTGTGTGGRARSGLRAWMECEHDGRRSADRSCCTY